MKNHDEPSQQEVEKMMDVSLQVLNGGQAGRIVAVRGGKFLIGRAEDCQLRPRSELISRHHCALIIENDYLAIRDFGSKNGTLLNGSRITKEQRLHDGDRLSIGPLEFAVVVHSSVEAVARQSMESAQRHTPHAGMPTAGEGEFIQDEGTAATQTHTISAQETEQIDLSIETTTISQPAAPQPDAPPTKPISPRPLGKLQPFTPPTKADSGSAASDVLNKFFKRR